MSILTILTARMGLGPASTTPEIQLLLYPDSLLLLQPVPHHHTYSTFPHLIVEPMKKKIVLTINFMGSRNFKAADWIISVFMPFD